MRKIDHLRFDLPKKGTMCGSNGLIQTPETGNENLLVLNSFDFRAQICIAISIIK